MQFDPTQLEEYHTQGYVIIPCPFPADLTHNCLEAVTKVAIDPADNTTDTKGNHYTLKPQVPDSYWCALDHSLPFLQIELHHEIIQLARQLAGDEDVYFRNGGINELAPGLSFVWHRDAEEEYVEFMHYFSGSSPQNGCLRVIPGSHIGPAAPWVTRVEELRQARGDSGPDRSRADVELPGEVSISLQPDQMLVRSSRIFHATWLNDSDQGRLMHHWLFRESDSNNHRFRFEEYLTEELINTLTMQQLRVLWLGRDFELDPKWDGERKREAGRTQWGLV
jgi:ectoine hydroxylase-related dioxygenase (phytanoyl-CoA dioxygenase family)